MTKHRRPVIVHIGNEATGPGGIASVIRQHLRRAADGPTIEVVAVTTYRVGQSFVLGVVTFAGAVARLIGLRSTGGGIAHVHLSQRGSIIREGLLIPLLRTLRFRGVVVTVHGSSIHQTKGLLRWLLQRELRAAHRVHVLSQEHQTLLATWAIESAILPNDVEVPRAVAPLARRQKRVVFLGETSTRKGIDVLLHAWRRLGERFPAWSLVIAGEAHPSGREFMSDLPDRVHYLGVLTRPDVQKLLEDSRIFVLASRAETFPMALCEAMARGCVVVSSAVGAVPEILCAELSAQLLDEISVENLEHRLRELISASDQLQVLAAANRRRVREFAEPRVSALWHALYQPLLDDGVGTEFR